MRCVFAPGGDHCYKREDNENENQDVEFIFHMVVCVNSIGITRAVFVPLKLRLNSGLALLENTLAKMQFALGFKNELGLSYPTYLLIVPRLPIMQSAIRAWFPWCNSHEVFRHPSARFMEFNSSITRHVSSLGLRVGAKIAPCKSESMAGQ